MTRKKRLLEYLASEDFTAEFLARVLREYEDAEGKISSLPSDLARFAHFDYSGTYAWLAFYDELDQCQPDDGFSSVVVLDLDTGDTYEPITTWKKVSR